MFDEIEQFVSNNLDNVSIPRAQLEALISDQAELVSLKLYIEELERKNEALMAAAKVVTDRDSDPSTWMRKRYEALAALRAAGLDPEDGT